MYTYNIDELRQPESKFDNQFVCVVHDRSYQLVVSTLAQQVIVQAFCVRVGHRCRCKINSPVHHYLDHCLLLHETQSKCKREQFNNLCCNSVVVIVAAKVACNKNENCKLYADFI